MGRRLFLAALAAALLAPPVAPAGDAEGQPRERLTASDNARARSAVLRRSDLSPLFQPDSRGLVLNVIPHCSGYPGDRSNVTITGEAQAGFSVGAAKVGSSTVFFKTQFDAERYWKLTVRRAFASCDAYWARRLLKRGAKGRTLAAGQVRMPPTGADDAAAFRSVTRITWPGHRGYDMYNVTSFVRVGRGIAILKNTYGNRTCVCTADLARKLTQRLSTASR